MPAAPTELAPVAVERVARRVATTHRSAAMRLRIVSAASFLILIPVGLLQPEYVTMFVGLPGVLGGLAFLASQRRKKAAEAADAIALAAASRPELAWRSHDGVITAAGTTLALAASPTEAELRGLLPAAHVVRDHERPRDE